jgi:hypothetical protein
MVFGLGSLGEEGEGMMIREGEVRRLYETCMKQLRLRLRHDDR